MLLLAAIVCGVRGAADAAPADQGTRVTEDEDHIKIETDKLEAVIPEKNPKHWMTGVEKGSFLDKSSGFRDGLMVVDWLMEPGSDEDYGDFQFAKDGHGLSRYLWYAVYEQYKGHTALSADESGWRLEK
jgi:hypothetical protein